MRKKERVWIYFLYNTGIYLISLIISIESNAQEGSQSTNDVDGNVYKTVKIGDQTWMVENLKTTRYNDSSSIQSVTDNSAWANLNTPAYCWYSNDETGNRTTYGALYNWYAVNSDKLCPAGWHVPLNDEWKALATYVNDDGGKLKEAGITHWYNPNVGATNTSGFTALMGGFRSREGVYYSNRQAGFWWSATECNECDAFPEWNFSDAWAFSLGARSSGYGNQHNNKLYGYSIRCLKDK
jgi:uncharacterized protein (TIGR02145 family)